MNRSACGFPSRAVLASARAVVLVSPAESLDGLHRLLLVAGAAHAEQAELGPHERAVRTRARGVVGRVPRTGARIPDLRLDERPERTGPRRDGETAGEEHPSISEQRGLRDEARRREAPGVREL